MALRIDEEQKARLEQLAEERDVTLSRAFREGAFLYLSELREKAHRARGGDVTFLGLRRDDEGRTLNKPSEPTSGEQERLRSLAAGIESRGLGDIRDAWEAGASSSVVLAALGQWLSVIGRLYVSNAGEVGWDWFLRDYCPGYEKPEASEGLRRVIRSALVSPPSVDVPRSWIRSLPDVRGSSTTPRRKMLSVARSFRFGSCLNGRLMREDRARNRCISRLAAAGTRCDPRSVDSYWRILVEARGGLSRDRLERSRRRTYALPKGGRDKRFHAFECHLRRAFVLLDGRRPRTSSTLIRRERFGGPESESRTFIAQASMSCSGFAPRLSV